MMKMLLGALLGLAVSGAAASDWDHAANIRAAVDEVVASYRLGGSTAMQKVVGNCYGQVAEGDQGDGGLRRLEYCAGMDFAAFRLDAREAHRAAEAYFAVEKVVVRVARLSDFVSDPNARDRIIRAWSRASAAALDEYGF